jgi:nitrate reductase delta subunit
MNPLGPVCDAVAALLEYPGEPQASRLAAFGRAGAGVPPDVAAGVDRFRARAEAMSPEDLQDLFTATFDFNPRCSLDVGWHLFGEGHARGAFLADLRRDLRAAGIEEGIELPDHLPHVLRLVARVGEPRASELAGAAHVAIGRMRQALEGDDNPYSELLAAADGCVMAAAVAGSL